MTSLKPGNEITKTWHELLRPAKAKAQHGEQGLRATCCEGDRPPRSGPTAGSGVQGEMQALVGPITPKAECNITDRKQQIRYPCYCIKDTQSLKDR